MKTLIESAKATLETAQRKLDEGRMKELHGYMEKGMSAQDIAKKMKLDVKTIQALMDETDIEEEVEIDEMKMDDPKLNKIFDKLKKGQTIKLKTSSTISKGKDFVEYIVKSKNTVNKGRVEKVTLVTKGNEGAVKKFLYKRDGKVTFAIGDMGASIDDIKEAMDPVDPKAVKKDFKDRKDKDIDNDGDVDDSDEYLHKKRKAISKSKNKEDEPSGEKGETATMNPKKEQKESTIRNRLMSIWEDAAGTKRNKDQNRDEQPTDRNASAKKMKDGHPVDTTSKLTDYDELGHDDASKAGRAGPSSKTRTNDSEIGDKKILNKIASAYKGMKNGD